MREHWLQLSLGVLMLLAGITVLGTAQRQGQMVIVGLTPRGRGALFFVLAAYWLYRGTGAVAPQSAQIAVLALVVVAFIGTWLVSRTYASTAQPQSMRSAEQRERLERGARAIFVMVPGWLALGAVACLLAKTIPEPLPFALGPASWLCPLCFSVSGAGTMLQGLALRMDHDSPLWRWWVLALLTVPAGALMMVSLAFIAGNATPLGVIPYAMVYGPLIALIMSAIMTPLTRRLAH